jgi:hypothetical protein
MIYIPKKITQRLLCSILSVAKELGASRFVIWFYPKTSERERARLLARFQHFQIGRDAVEPITLYGLDGEPIEKTPMVFKLDSASIERLASLLSKLTRLSDCVAAYKKDSPEFICCSVFHETMSLFNDSSELEPALTKWGIPFTALAPAGW